MSHSVKTIAVDELIADNREFRNTQHISTM